MSELIVSYVKAHPTAITAYLGVALVTVGTILSAGLASGVTVGGLLLLVVALVRGLHESGF